MIPKKKVGLLLALLLAAAPFLRGCSGTVSFGFPLPMAYAEHSWKIIYFLIRGVRFINILIFAANILLILCAAKIIIPLFKGKNIDKSYLFLNALGVNLCLLWCIIFFQASQKVVLAIAYYTHVVPFLVFENSILAGGLGKTTHEWIIDVFARVWFVIITFILTGLFCLIDLLITLRKKRSSVVS